MREPAGDMVAGWNHGSKHPAQAVLEVLLGSDEGGVLRPHCGSLHFGLRWSRKPPVEMTGFGGEGLGFGQEASRLAWGPAHVPAAEQVDVEVVDGLAAIGAGVDDQAVAVVETLARATSPAAARRWPSSAASSGKACACEAMWRLGMSRTCVGRLRVDVREGEDVVRPRRGG